MKIEKVTKFDEKERKSLQSVARKTEYNILGVHFIIPMFTLRNA